MQADPMKPTLTAPGTKLSKLQSDEPRSKFAFKLNLRRYNEGAAEKGVDLRRTGIFTFLAWASQPECIFQLNQTVCL